MIEIEGKVIVRGNSFSFEGPQAETLLRLFERKIEDAKDQGKFDLINGIIKGLSK